MNYHEFEEVRETASLEVQLYGMYAIDLSYGTVMVITIQQVVLDCERVTPCNKNQLCIYKRMKCKASQRRAHH